MSRASSAPVLLIADHKWRDLASLALLKVELEDVHGVPARIVNYTMWDAALLAFRPQVVCPTTQTGPREQRIARMTRASGARTVVIPTEGIPSAWKVMPILGCANVDVTNVDLWFTWNDLVRDYMLEHTPLSAGQVITTGVNRFDFYVAPLRRMLKSREQLDREYGLRRGRPIVTWATNFAHAGYALADGDFIQDDWTVRGLTTIPGYADARGYAAADLRSMIDARQMMLGMFRQFPDVNFIIKTHPAERLDLYVEYLVECRKSGAVNVTLVSQEYIGNLLNSTDVLVHRYCTTGLEAWIMGIPTLGMHLKDWHADGAGGGALGDAAQVDHLVTTADDISAGLTRYLSGAGVEESTQSARRAVLEKWLTRLDGRSTARQAAAIAAIAHSGGVVPRRNPFAFGMQLRGAGKRLAQMAVNRALGRPFDLAFSAPATHGGVEVNELGYADRLARQPDVEAWCTTLRAFRATSPAVMTAVPAGTER